MHPISEKSRTQPLTLREMLRREGLTVAEIARRCGLSEMAVNDSLTGKRITAKTQRAIAEALGTTPSALFGDLCHPHARHATSAA